MIDIPDMPEDWWPEQVLVTGKHGNIELCFIVNGDEQSGAYVSLVPANLDGLRHAIWHTLHDPASVGLVS